MKKFLVFLVAIIATVCIGVTFYQFAKNDEVIRVNTEIIYINYGDKLTLEDIGFSRKEASKETKIDFNAGGDEVTSIIKYDELSGCYIPTSKGGATTIKISTTNRKYKSFSIDVVVGIGTEEFPYYISTEKQLFEITNSNIDNNSCFELVKDIKLTEKHTPIGLIDGGYREFVGKFNGGYHTISNLNIESCDYAGLFAILGTNSEVYNLNVANSIIEGSFVNVGTIAGTCYGNINKVVVSNSTITNDKSASNTGAVVGLLATDNLNNVTASILRTSAYTDDNKVITGNGNVGGLAGSVNSAMIHACYTQLCLKNTSTAPTGGLVGNLVVNNNTYIRESYVVAQFDTKGICGNIAGNIAFRSGTNLGDVNKSLVLVGLYYEKTLNKYGGVGLDNNNFATATTFAVSGKTTAEMKNKNTYVYYVNNSNNIIYWDKVWYLVDGQYPQLTFVNKFDDVVLDGDKLPTTPNDPSQPDISDPETPNSSAIIISTKQQLISVFQSSNNVNGNYILNTNIDLGGMNWIPVKFSGTFKSTDKYNYSISNFKIVGDNLLYAGFFYDLASATIKNITFNNVTLSSSTSLQAAGIVVGHIRGNVVIDNVDVVTAKIDTTTQYAGGIAGYVNNVITKISLCDAQGLTTEGNIANLGGIAGYVAKNGYIVSCKVKNSNSLNAIDRIGGISAVNYGTIYDCSFNGNINSINSSAVGYFGGLAGINHSAIINSSAFAEIAVNNSNSIESQIFYYAGGLVGYNIGDITNCSIYADELSAKESTGVVFLAGLTAYNSGNLKLCYADILNIGSVQNNIYTAGLSVFNYGGKIFGCFQFGNLNGYQVAGLVRTNTNDGIVDSCMTGLNETDRASYKGVQLASFTYDISSGKITDCIVNANLNCTNAKGWIAGFAGFMPLTNDKYGTISNSIANVSFDGVGTNYLDIAQDGLLKKKRTTGTITKCIISSDANIDGVIISERTKILWVSQTPGSASSYIIASAEALLKMETYLDPAVGNFDISTGITNTKWVYINNSRLPLPRTFLEVFGYDILGF